MTTELTTPKTFEEKMRDRIRESIGDLMSNEDLKKLLDRAVEENFFKEKVVMSEWGREQSRKPALLIGLVKELLAERMNEVIKQWLADNEEQVKKTLDEVVKMGVGGAYIAALNSQFSSQLLSLQIGLEQQIRMKP
jgi:hypothetical protein